MYEYLDILRPVADSRVRHDRLTAGLPIEPAKGASQADIAIFFKGLNAEIMIHINAMMEASGLLSDDDGNGVGTAAEFAQGIEKAIQYRQNEYPDAKTHPGLFAASTAKAEAQQVELASQADQAMMDSDVGKMIQSAGASLDELQDLIAQFQADNDMSNANILTCEGMFTVIRKSHNDIFDTLQAKRMADEISVKMYESLLSLVQIQMKARIQSSELIMK